VPGVPERL